MFIRLFLNSTPICSWCECETQTLIFWPILLSHDNTNSGDFIFILPVCAQYMLHKISAVDGVGSWQATVVGKRLHFLSSICCYCLGIVLNHHHRGFCTIHAKPTKRTCLIPLWWTVGEIQSAPCIRGPSVRFIISQVEKTHDYWWRYFIKILCLIPLWWTVVEIQSVPCIRGLTVW